MQTRQIFFLTAFSSSLLAGLVFNFCVTSFTLFSIIFWISISYVIGFIVSGLYVKLCLVPFSDMTKAVKEMVKDQITPRVRVPKRAEFAAIARAINDMSEIWQERIAKISGDKNELEAILSSMVEGVVVINPQDRIVHLSPNFRDMLELRSKNTNNRLYWEIIWNNEINNSIKESILERKTVRREIEIIGQKSGVFDMHISPVVHSSGRLISVVAVFHDITELKKLERMRTEFVANVSHELKTPLTAIKGFVETLLNGALEDQVNAKRFLGIINKQTERLENLVKDLLVLSSIESQEISFSFKADSLEKVINGVLLLQKQSIDQKKITIIQDFQSALPKVLIDHERIEQVFVNLIDNAVKFSPENGTITIKLVIDGAFLRCDIIDTGIGIASEHLSRIFERFYRVDKARSRDAGGTGLGLSIVKHIVQAHRGKVDVSSIQGVGSTFSIFLPIHK